MPKRGYRWVRVKPLTKEEKAAVTEACERLIAEKLKPRFLPEVRPSKQNYPVDIRGRWRSNTYAFSCATVPAGRRMLARSSTGRSPASTT